jgi:heme-degrading monooxygenase HmoA
VVYVSWDSQKNCKAYMSSELFKQSHSNMTDQANAFTGSPSLEKYEIANEVMAP